MDVERIIAEAVWDDGTRLTRPFRSRVNAVSYNDDVNSVDVERVSQVSNDLWTLVEHAPKELFQHHLAVLNDPAQAGAATLLTTSVNTVKVSAEAQALYYWLVMAPPDPRSSKLWPTVALRFQLDPETVLSREELLALPNSTLVHLPDNEDVEAVKSERQLRKRQKESRLQPIVQGLTESCRCGRLVQSTTPADETASVQSTIVTSTATVKQQVIQCVDEWNSLATGWQLAELLEDHFSVYHVDALLKWLRDYPTWSPLSAAQRRQLLVAWLSDSPELIGELDDHVNDGANGPGTDAADSSDTLSDVDCD